jgi:hypothetical protein
LCQNLPHKFDGIRAFVSHRCHDGQANFISVH